MATDLNLWKQIGICGNGLQSVATDSNLWEQIRICGNKFETVATDSKYFYFSDVPLKASYNCHLLCDDIRCFNSITLWVMINRFGTVFDVLIEYT